MDPPHCSGGGGGDRLILFGGRGNMTRVKRNNKKNVTEKSGIRKDKGKFKVKMVFLNNGKRGSTRR